MSGGDFMILRWLGNVVLSSLVLLVLIQIVRFFCWIKYSRDFWRDAKNWMLSAFCVCLFLGLLLTSRILYNADNDYWHWPLIPLANPGTCFLFYEIWGDFLEDTPLKSSWLWWLGERFAETSPIWVPMSLLLWNMGS